MTVMPHTAAVDVAGDVRQWVDKTRSPTVQKIMDVALNQFYIYGARATTVRQITKAAGLTTGALYNYFESKEDLLYAIIADRHLWVESRLILAQNAVLGDPREEFRSMVSEFLQLHVPGQRAIHIANREFRVLTGPRHAEVVGIRRRIRDRLANTINAGQEAGVFDLPGGSDTGTLMAIDVLELCISINTWYVEGRGIASDDLIKRYETMAMRLVLPNSAVGDR